MICACHLRVRIVEYKKYRRLRWIGHVVIRRTPNNCVCKELDVGRDHVFVLVLLDLRDLLSELLASRVCSICTKAIETVLRILH